jgi:hypothetical protein
MPTTSEASFSPTLALLSIGTLRTVPTVTNLCPSGRRGSHGGGDLSVVPRVTFRRGSRFSVGG